MIKITVSVLCLVLTFLFAYRTSVFRTIENFHEVDPGRFYRSAQLTDDELRTVVAKYHIKTVINLRGPQPEEEWYQNEEKVVDEMGIHLIDIGFNSQTVPRRAALIQYLTTLKNAPRPILVHCRAGSDRTGEASAIYAIEYMNQSREKALEQLSSKYLHFQVFQPAKKYFISHYGGPQWASKTYSECSSEFRKYSEWNGSCEFNSNEDEGFNYHVTQGVRRILSNSWHVPLFESYQQHNPQIFWLKRAYGYMNF